MRMEKLTGCRRLSVLIFISIVAKIISFVLFCLISSFVLLFGKNGSGIKLLFAFAAMLLIGVIVL